MNGVEPGFDQHGPVGDGKIGWTEAVAVTASSEDVEFGWNFGLLEGLEVDEGVFLVDGIVLRLEEEGGRGVGCGIDAVGEFVECRPIGKVAGIDDDGEVGAGVEFVDGLVGPFVVGVIAEGDDEMRPGGEAESAEAVGVDVPLCGVGASDAHGLLGVFEVGSVFRIVIGERDAVLDEEAVDPDGVEPGADLGSFEIVGEDAVASAGEDEDGCAGVFGGWSRIEGEGGLADAGEVHQRLVGYEAVSGERGVVLGAAGVGLRCAIGPERKGDLLGASERRGKKSEGQKEGGFHEAMVLDFVDGGTGDR